MPTAIRSGPPPLSAVLCVAGRLHAPAATVRTVLLMQGSHCRMSIARPCVHTFVL